jgi:hypothetical protein
MNTKRRQRVNPGVAVYFYDDEQAHLYTAPPTAMSSARQVSAEELKQATKTKTVILVSYMEGLVSEPG